MEPTQHDFSSGRLTLRFWDYGQNGNPPVVLLHGWLDHARNWDLVAQSLRECYHVYAVDLRGHGDSDWAPGGIYSPAEYVLDLAALLDQIGGFPVRLIGHCLGGAIVLSYAGVYPERVRNVVSIEGLGLPVEHYSTGGPASQRLRHWMEAVRGLQRRAPPGEANLDAAIARMKEANPRLSDELARHMTVHGTRVDSSGRVSWKYDSFARILPPYGNQIEEALDVFGRISAPALVFWGAQSFLRVADQSARLKAIRNCRLVSIANAGHWVYHDQLDRFLEETLDFLAD